MKKNLRPEDLLLWQNQLRDVKPLSKENKAPEEPYISKKQKQVQPHVPSLQKQLKREQPSLALQSFERKELRQLKIEGRLDMHGMNMNEAHEALERFLRRAQEKQLKIVLIITGKGSLHSENTLRHQVPRWIKEAPFTSLVSSFHAPAKPQDGGAGACYIGLRKRKGV